MSLRGKVRWIVLAAFGMLIALGLNAISSPSRAATSEPPCLLNRIILRDTSGAERVISTQAGFHPALSPDGVRVVYNTSEGQIRLIEGMTDRPLRPGYNPDWIDATTLLYMKLESTGEASVVSYSLTTGLEAPLLSYTDRSIYYPHLSPDGTRLVFTRTIPPGQPNEGQFDLVIYTLASGQETVLQTGYFSWPNWSPDGTHLVLSYNEAADGSYDIATMKVDGTDLIQITTGGLNFSPRWESDDRIYFTEGRSLSEIYSLKPDGTDLRRIAYGRAPDYRDGVVVYSDNVCPPSTDLACGNTQLGAVGTAQGSGFNGGLTILADLNQATTHLDFSIPADGNATIQNWSPRDVFQNGPMWENPTAGVYIGTYAMLDMFRADSRLTLNYENLDGTVASEPMICGRTTYHVSGVVLDTRGRGVSTATITVTSRFGALMLVTGDDGTFTIPWLANGDYQIRVGKAGYQFPLESVTVDDQRRYPADVSGMVVQSTSDPIEVTPTTPTTAPTTPTNGTPTLTPTGVTPTTSPSTTPSATPGGPTPRAFVSKNPNTGFVRQNEVFTYTLTVRNTGESVIAGTLTDLLPNDVQYVDNPGGDYDSGAKLASWPVTNLEPGTTQTFLFVVKAVYSGPPENLVRMPNNADQASPASMAVIGNMAYQLTTSDGVQFDGIPVYVTLDTRAESPGCDASDPLCQLWKSHFPMVTR